VKDAHKKGREPTGAGIIVVTLSIAN